MFINPFMLDFTMAKKQQKKASKRVQARPTRMPRKKQTAHTKALPVITTTLTSTEGGCADSLTLSMQVDKDKIVQLSVKPAATCCPEVKKISQRVEEHAVGKHIGDIYSLKEEFFDAKAMPHHSSTLVIHALRQAILEYESKKATATLHEALTMLQEYDKGLPERDLGTDYEY